MDNTAAYIVQEIIKSIGNLDDFYVEYIIKNNRALRETRKELKEF